MKQFIKNRKGENICVLFEKAEDSKNIVFVMHGLGGFKEQNHITIFAKVFLDNNISVISFDTTNTFGESDGNYENATTTNYYEDLEDVISWSKTQSFYKEPFYLAGHSLGGISIIMYAQKNIKEVKALAPISSVVSGQMTINIIPKEDLEKWKKDGFKIKESESKPGIIKKLKFSHLADRAKYNILPEANKLNLPVLLIVGENDDTTPIIHQELLYNELPGYKELHIIKGCGHTPRKENELNEIYNLFDKWIKKNEL